MKSLTKLFKTVYAVTCKDTEGDLWIFKSTLEPVYVQNEQNVTDYATNIASARSRYINVQVKFLTDLRTGQIDRLTQDELMFNPRTLKIQKIEMNILRVSAEPEQVKRQRHPLVY